MKLKISSAVTLPELLISVSILAFIILPIFGLLNFTNRGTREQDAEGIAANLAKEEMNRLMFVISRDNLLVGAGAAQPWSFGADYDVKGNKFSGEYTVYPFTNAELNFSLPNFKFHDPMLCAAGIESDAPNALAAPKNMTIAEVYPDSVNLCRLADIRLVVRWKLPNTDYNAVSQFELVTRRAFLVKE